MSDLKQQILELHKVSEALEPSPEQRKQYIKEIGDYAGRFIDDLKTNKTYTSDKDVTNAFVLNHKKNTLHDLLKLYDTEIAQKGIKPASGGHLGYIPGGGIFGSALADFLVDVTNEYVGMHFACPGGVSIEIELLNWMKDVFGFPTSAVGNLASGGSMANLIALTAARDKHKIKNALIEKSVIYMSPQVHHCVHKAIKIIGLEDVIVNYLELDEFHKIKTDDLEEKIAADKANGLNPFLMVASAGTTDTGAIDPLETIGEIAKTNNLWYHIDAAYGGFFILVERMKAKFKGIEMADSLVVDPHKGMFLPYGLGAVLIKDKQAAYHSHLVRANYMQDAVMEETPVNPADVSPELTKHFRSLRLWLPMQLHGLAPFVACLDEKLLLTQYFRQRLVDIGFMIGPEPDLSVSYFWYPTGDKNENTFNQNIMKELLNDGDVFMSSTLIEGQFVIRMALLSFRTKIETIDKAIAMLERIVENLLNEHDDE